GVLGRLGADPRAEHELVAVDPVDADPVVVAEPLVQQVDDALGGGLRTGRFGDVGPDHVEGVPVLDGALLGDGVAHWFPAQRSAQRSIPAMAERRSVPLSVSEYSTQGGTVLMARRSMSPSSSSSFNRCESVAELAPPSASWSS